MCLTIFNFSTLTVCDTCSCDYIVPTVLVKAKILCVKVVHIPNKLVWFLSAVPHVGCRLLIVAELLSLFYGVLWQQGHASCHWWHLLEACKKFLSFRKGVCEICKRPIPSTALFQFLFSVPQRTSEYESSVRMQTSHRPEVIMKKSRDWGRTRDRQSIRNSKFYLKYVTSEVHHILV